MRATNGAQAAWLDALFDLRGRTTLRREVLAGATTFVTMAYILFVDPQSCPPRRGRGAPVPCWPPPRWSQR